MHVEIRPRPAATPAHARARRLTWVLALTVAYMLAEVAGGVASNSLALLADAGHMATDALALSLAAFAGWVARRPPDAGRTFGYQRAEILAALANGAILVLVCGFIFWEAFRRFGAPPEVRTGLMAAVAAGGLAVNGVAAWMLHEHVHELNARAAFLHVLGDLLGSIGTLLAAGAIVAFGWRWADPLASVLIGLVIVYSSIRLVLASIHVLMEGAPAHLDGEDIRRSLLALRGVVGVHDLHLWSLGGRAPLLTAHLVIDHSARAHDVLRAATHELATRYGVGHVTIQIEPPDFNIVGIGGAAVDASKTSP
ncbi:MAG TPA: cation diffusion facilitator family transporter [Candidatus Polarisedimenticolaceae bacterium]|nr:cation diffusion facilitator family transporter [Candidatus Polarisedimenticolaceae bacterium]